MKSQIYRFMELKTDDTVILVACALVIITALVFASKLEKYFQK